MTLADETAALLGEPVVDVQRLAGGDISDVLRLTLDGGGGVVAKSGPAPRTEAAMLGALRAAGVPAPKVIAVSDRVLVLEALPERGALGPGGWAKLGAALKTLHTAAGASYGWDTDFAFGPLRIPNAPCDNWPDFWAERRLLAHIDRLPPALARRIEALSSALPLRLPSHPVAGLLHGDLWTGNVIACDGALQGLIDPACYYGHGEVDLAMLHLFGAPPPAVYDGYGALETGWQARRAIYTLWPAIVHVCLFGASYHGLVDRLLSELKC